MTCEYCDQPCECDEELPISWRPPPPHATAKRTTIPKIDIIIPYPDGEWRPLTRPDAEMWGFLHGPDPIVRTGTGHGWIRIDVQPTMCWIDNYRDVMRLKHHYR